MQTVEKIGKRFWYMTPVSETDRPVLGMVIGEKRNLMIDAGNSEAHTKLFLDMLAEQDVKKPAYVLLSHWHWDHIFGLSALTDTFTISSKQTKTEMEKLIPLSWSDEALDQRVALGTEIEFCSAAIKKEFPEERKINITLPVMTIEDEVEIDLGGITCVMKHVGGDHAADSTVVYIKEEKILFVADCMYADIFSQKWNYTIDGTRALLEKLEKFDAETYILSHGLPITKEEFQNEVFMLSTIADLTEKHKGEHKSITLEYQKHLGRGLSEDELETIEYFVNGHEMNHS
ncbi:MBL fold metallo-hydrolase [Mesobacillus subterraneus]|uniref:MBL fold metallo-hydrolase n=1 Tax=Mesobacillus subterraneus TaxID=285983 RepID=A0A3R9FG33_9BACI|nr:MBL fold metallo-hydrolase [Mesobacillus subterraneus]RSD25583.1 MBL fold metallo-hydrolase [Mesobacillus subterraneus]